MQDIVSWGEMLAAHIHRMDETQFLADAKTQHAVSKCVEVIGEAARRAMEIDPELGLRPDLDFRAAYATRNKLAHGYQDIDGELLWVTATESVPPLVAAVEAFLGRLDSPET